MVRGSIGGGTPTRVARAVIDSAEAVIAPHWSHQDRGDVS